ncbi:MAG TPA: hypothetical protein VKU93_01460, partial [Terracidiphilus sp.]|nr:hypothetical protein [Terracidiphilus sp.]
LALLLRVLLRLLTEGAIDRRGGACENGDGKQGPYRTERSAMAQLGHKDLAKQAYGIAGNRRSRTITRVWTSAAHADSLEPGSARRLAVLL